MVKMWRWFMCWFLCGLLWTTTHVWAQPDGDTVSQYRTIKHRGTDYIADGPATLFVQPDSIGPLRTLKHQEPVHRLQQNGLWTRIRTRNGEIGYVATQALSNIWLYVSKNEKVVYIYRELDLIEKLPVDLSVNIKGDKIRRGSSRNPSDWRTPEGIFYVSRKNPNSRFYKAVVLSYPTPLHAVRAHTAGIINRDQYSSIVKAHRLLENPPMRTPMGGWIEFHGSGILGQANWTWGCIALENHLMDIIWKWTEVGTPVLIGSFNPRHTARPGKVQPKAPAVQPLDLSTPDIRDLD